MFTESDDPEAQRLAFEALAYATQAASLFWLAMTTVVLYDHVSTFDLEVELVWKKRWSFIKLLYIINRYLPDAAFLYGSSLVVWVPNEEFIKLCPSFPRVQTWLSVISLIAMQGIMVHRIICMYSYNRKIIIGLLSGYAVILIGGVTFSGLLMRVDSTIFFLSSSLRLCVPLNIPSFNVANWFLMMTFDLIIVGLAISEAIRYIRGSRNLHNSAGIFAGTRFAKQGTIFRILLRDSIIFPIIGLLISVFNLLATYVLVDAIAYMLVITAAASPILGCRLILHLRDAYYQPFKSEFDRNNHGDAQPEMPSFALQSTTHSSNKRSSRTSEEAVP